MLRALLGVGITTVVLFMWGFLFWAALPFQNWTLKAPTDDAAAREALRDHFPENGSYIVPTFVADEAELTKAYEDGPIAFVHMLRVDGRPVIEPSIMIKGFLLNTVVIALIAGILAIAARPTYFERVQLCGAVGLAAALLINYGGVVWWEISKPWELYNALYNFSFFLIAGAILGAFVVPRKPAATQG